MHEPSASRLTLATERKALVALALAVTGCGNFGSLKPFQKSIDATRDAVPVLERRRDFCDLRDAIVGTQPSATAPAVPAGNSAVQQVTKCANQAPEKLVRAVKKLSAYATSLGELGETSDLELGDATEALVKFGDAAAGAETEEGVSDAVVAASNILTKAVTHGYKRREIAKALRTTDRSVQCIAARSLFVIANGRVDVDEQLKKLDGINDKDQSYLKLLQEELKGTPSGSAAEAVRRDIIMIRSVALHYRELSSEFEQLERGLKAVAVAHSVLACGADDIGTGDDDDLKSKVEQGIKCVSVDPAKWASKGLDAKTCQPIFDRTNIAATDAGWNEANARCSNLQAPPQCGP